MSLSIETLRLLTEKGLSASDILEIAESIEATKPKRSGSAERMARKRARDNARNQSVTCDVTVTSQSLSPLDPPFLSPTPPNYPPYNPPKPQKRAATVSDPSLFEPCWLAYPHVKSRMAKSKTQTEFAKLPPAEQKSLLATINSFSSSLKNRDLDFVPAMERWIRDGKHRAFMAIDGPTVDKSILIKAYQTSGIWHREWGERPTEQEISLNRKSLEGMK